MGQMAQTWKPWPLAPLPPGPGLTWSQLEEEPTLVSGSIEATARASDATIVPSLEASTSALSRNFSIGNHPSGSFLLVHTLLAHNQIKHTRRTLHPPSLPSPRNRCLSLPQTVKHRTGAKATPESTPRTPEHTLGTTCGATIPWFLNGVSRRSTSEDGSEHVMAFWPPVGKEGN